MESWSYSPAAGEDVRSSPSAGRERRIGAVCFPVRLGGKFAAPYFLLISAESVDQSMNRGTVRMWLVGLLQLIYLSLNRLSELGPSERQPAAGSR